MASLFDSQAITPELSGIEHQIITLSLAGIWGALLIADEPNVLVLRYENFCSDVDSLVAMIADFFGCGR